MHCDCGACPVVIVPGIGQSKAIEVDEQGNKIKNAWPLDLDAKGAFKPLLFRAALMLLTRRGCGLPKKAGSAIENALDTLACNPNGSRKHNIKVVSYNYPLSECSEEEKKYIYRMVPLYSLAERIGESHLFYFAYDIFGQIERTAEELDKFIQMVKAKTGHEKVSLLPVSMGAVISEAYLARYAEKKEIHRVVGVVPAYNGSVFVADLLSGNIDLGDYESLFINLLGRGDGGRINKLLAKVPKRVLNEMLTEILEGALRAIYINSSTMWSLMPAANYEELSKKYISDKAHSELKKQTDAAWEIRKDFKKFIDEMTAHEIEFFTLCGYNVPFFDAVGSKTVSSDMVVDTFSASMGARLAPLGKSFESGYAQQNLCCSESHNHLSPGNDVDASCGAIPDTTWYWKNMEHEQSADNKALLELAMLLLKDDELKDVFQNSDYPQFMEYAK